MNFAVNDRVVVITGASRGLGAAFAEHFAQEGALLGLLSRNETALANFANRLPTDVVTVGCDVTNESQVSESFRRIANRFGRIDSVIANAGGQSTALRADQLPVDKWREIVDLNLTGSYITARCAYRYLREAEAGRLLFVSSGAARIPLSHTSAYSAAKAGIESLARALCVEWSDDDICVNVVSPGLIDTDGSQEMPRKIREYIANRTAFGRAGKPSDLMAMMQFLAGDGASYVTGQVVCIDGGYGLQ